MAEADERIAARYRLLSRAGHGAMGVVWHAEDERLERPVALKQVALPTGADEQTVDRARRRVMREGRMIARLHHPHAITVYDVVEHDRAPWLVMEYLPSRSLAQVLAQDGPLHPVVAARLGRQVADALAAAHEAGIVHRDVKPGNVLIGDAGTVKVTDFGIARAVDDVTITSAGQMAGTPAYLAPEVARGAAADFRSDVYSLGSTLYAATEGAPPFGTGDNALAVLHRVAVGAHPPPRHAGPLTPLLRSLLERDPARRPAMRQVRDDLARLVTAEDGTEEGPLTPILTRPADGTAPDSPPEPSEPSRHAVSGPSGTSTPSPAPSAPSAPGIPAPLANAPAANAPAAPAPAAPAAPSLPEGPAAPAHDGHGGRAGAVAQAPVDGARASMTRPATTAPVTAPDRDGEDPGDDGAPVRGRRWPWLVAVGAVVALVALVAVAALLGESGDRTGASVPGGSVSSTPDPGDAGTAAPGAASGGGSAGNDTGGSVAITGSPEDQARQQAVIDYYGLLPERLDEGWQRLTPRFQASTAGGYDNYRGFWGTVQQVTVRGVSPAGGDSVDATVTYRYANGRTVDERTVFGMAFQDGIWKIDSQRQAGG